MSARGGLVAAVLVVTFAAAAVLGLRATPGAGRSAAGGPMSTSRSSSGAAPAAERPGAPASALALQGFADGTTGGSGGRILTVTSLSDTGPGTLRAAMSEPGPTWVLFGVSGRIALADPIRVPSDTTIDGRGADITLSGKGLLVDGVHNVIVENLSFTGIRGSTSDAVSVRNGAQRVWIDHSSFSDGQDGLVDITYGATDVTVSWCHFFRHDKVMLISVLKGSGAMRVTVHHNWFDHTTQRNPLVRGAFAHVYDNVVDGWTGYGMQAQAGGYLLSQDNVLRAAPGSDRTDGIRIQNGRWGEGDVRAQGNLLLDGATQRVRLAQDMPAVGYAYTLEPAGADLVREITAGAGWQPYPATTTPRPLP